jgi:hypothetical protein
MSIDGNVHLIQLFTRPATRAEPWQVSLLLPSSVSFTNYTLPPSHPIHYIFAVAASCPTTRREVAFPTAAGPIAMDRSLRTALLLASLSHERALWDEREGCFRQTEIFHTIAVGQSSGL